MIVDTYMYGPIDLGGIFSSEYFQSTAVVHGFSELNLDCLEFSGIFSFSEHIQSDNLNMYRRAAELALSRSTVPLPRLDARLFMNRIVIIESV
eukprot:SAG31_NODE_1356_length_8657_cov_4.678546_2_plen_93_part_00